MSFSVGYPIETVMVRVTLVGLSGRSLIQVKSTATLIRV